MNAPAIQGEAGRGKARVDSLWRYPASSLAGESLTEMTVSTGGAQGDRLFGLVETATGEIARPEGGPKWHGAPRIAARLSENGVLEIRVLSGGGWMPAPGVEAERAASAIFGFDVSIRPFGDAGRQNDAIEPRYRKAPIHLLTTASLAELKAQHPAGNPDPRRFRPNILVDMPPVAGQFPETGWIGRTIAIGDLELIVSEPCRRCGFTIIAQEGIVSDPEILRTLVRKNAHNIGVYCTVIRPGVVRIGDTMRLVG